MKLEIGKRKERPNFAAPDTEPQVESAREGSPETRVETPAPKEVSRNESVPAAAPTTTPAPAPRRKDPGLAQVEAVLSEGLGDMYNDLPPAAKATFKKKGEEVAETIQEWRKGAKLVARKVLKLIRDWLKIVPRMNPFYLEQASKIKTDQIMALKDDVNEETLL